MNSVDFKASVHKHRREFERHSRWAERCDLATNELQNLAAAQSDRLQTLIEQFDSGAVDAATPSVSLGPAEQRSVQPSNQDWMRSIVDQLVVTRQQLDEAQLTIGQLQRELSVRSEWASKLENEATEKARWAEQADEHAARSAQQVRDLQLKVEELERELTARTEWANKLEKEGFEKARWAQQADEDATRSQQQVKAFQLKIKKLERELIEASDGRKELGDESSEPVHLAIPSSNEIKKYAGRVNGALGPGDNLDGFFRVASPVWRVTWPLRYLGRCIVRIFVRQLWNPFKWPEWIKRISVVYAEHGVRGFLQVKPYEKRGGAASKSG